MDVIDDTEDQSSPTYDHWIKEIQAEEKAHCKWRERGKKVMDRYRDEGQGGTRFNILWSNTQVMHAAVFSAQPKPDVTRRYRDPNAESRQIAEVTERALSYSVDSYDFEGHADLAVDDYLLPGLGQVRIRYVPYFEKGDPPVVNLTATEEVGEDEIPVTRYYNGEDEVTTPLFDELGNPYTYGEPEDELVYEEVTCESVPWDRFRWQPANTWNNVGWCAIDHYLTRKELREQFGDIANECPLGYADDGTKNKEDKEDGKQRALVHEIFDKESRKVIVICPGVTRPLKEESDPWSLEGFYPFPKPMMANVISNKMVPVPDYVMYQDLAQELDRITTRIERLTEELKYRGFYDGSFKEMVNIEGLGDGEFKPIDDFGERFADTNHKLDDIIMAMPLEELLRTITSLYQAREQIKQSIYEITGISDIIRGSSKASETLGAQQLKQQNASLRMTKKENEVARFFRDIFRLKAELIVEHFSADTLKMMTGIPVTPDMVQVMQNDMLRSYAIDVESDSTVASDRAEEQRNVTELLTAITSFMQQSAPLMQAGVPLEVLTEMLLFAVRRFKGGRQLEQALEKLNGSDVNGNQGTAPLPAQVGGQPAAL